jgi:type IV secretory pathway TraG/TraD family ATPase VirD4
MSTLYDRSRSAVCTTYFEGISAYRKRCATYNLDTHRMEYPSAIKPWEYRGTGIPLAYDSGNRDLYVDYTDAHSLIVGPTGSKKTRLIAMPTIKILSEAGESMIISDPKAELYERTAETLRAKEYRIYTINLREVEYGQQWNPLYIPYQFYLKGDIDRACEFANDVAENLIEKRNDHDPFWENSASAFLFGTIMTLFRYCKELNKSSNAATLTNLTELQEHLIKECDLKLQPLWKYAQEVPYVASAMVGTMETAKDTRGGILSSMKAQLRNFQIQPNLLKMLSGNDIDLDHIGTEPTAIFLITPDEKTTYHSLVSLFVKQSYEYLIFKAQYREQNDTISAGKIPRRVNYILDEFASLPKITDFPAMITAGRSRNIRFNLFLQSKNQLFQKYGNDEQTIRANCINWLFLSSREYELLNEISQLCGTMNDRKQLVSVTDLQRLDKEQGETLVLCDRLRPYIARLPDIDEIDLKNYRPASFKKHKHIDTELIDFGSLV